ncbi:hypothetical protein PHLCEN_2v3529 [Hermanssonia centrifuga]|uniref:Uncharacterized protein n=1 Tax=Hermanssonia centrifuga TaxID=98765 RepID=A0A2R6QEX9_9APHY|nr:hypothetical protein PHLCEN_2v3529 [Hermanssonia centrifuga]
MPSSPPVLSPPLSSPSRDNSPVTGSTDSSTQLSKRSFEVLSHALELESSRKKCKTDRPTAPFRHAARWVGRAIDPFVRLRDAFHVGAAFDAAEAEADEGETVSVPNDELVRSMTDKDRQLHRSVYQRTKSLVPNFCLILEGLAESAPGSQDTLLGTMTSITKQCRSDDIGTLKAIGLDIIENHGLLADEEVSWAKKKGSFKKNKSTRGFNDNIFGRLLCPHKYSQLYSQDPDGFCTKVLESDNDIIIQASDLPAFLYDCEYDASAIDRGLLRGPIVVQVYKGIFMSPSSVNLKDGDSNAKGRSSHGQLHGLSRATPHTIAYACMMARYFCSSLTSWREQDGKFSLHHFYYYVVALFEMDAESSWAVDTLDWWDRQVFGKGPRKFENSLMQAEQAADINSDFNALIAQRIARRANDDRS